MIVPIAQLAPDTLTAIIENFVLREGTEYGREDVAFADKVSQVRKQLHQGSAHLVYSELYETVNIVPTEHLQQTD